jgi:hypothetical protein
MAIRDLPSVEDLKILGIPMPDFYRRFIAAFGEAAAIKFCLEHGGARYFVPRKFSADGMLTARFGRDMARWLIVEVGQGWHTLPIWIRSGAVLRRFHIRRLIRDGHSVAVIVERAKVSDRQVLRERAYMRERHLINFPRADAEAGR